MNKSATKKIDYGGRRVETSEEISVFWESVPFRRRRICLPPEDAIFILNRPTEALAHHARRRSFTISDHFLGLAWTATHRNCHWLLGFIFIFIYSPSQLKLVENECVLLNGNGNIGLNFRSSQKVWLINFYFVCRKRSECACQRTTNVRSTQFSQPK